MQILRNYLESYSNDALIQLEPYAAVISQILPEVDQLFPGHNVGRVGSEYLIRMADAFDAIVAGRGESVTTEGNREYQFEGFSIIVPDTTTSD